MADPFISLRRQYIELTHKIKSIVESPDNIMPDKIIAAKPQAEVLDYLLHRRSVSVKHLGAPGPDPEQVNIILKAAARVPDHGRMNPWYFVVFSGEARIQAGEILKKAWLAEEMDAAPAKLELEAERFLRAPVVVAVISRVREGKHPLWEQVLSAGAACQNLCLAANAMGFGTNWVTEWYAYSNIFRNELRLDERDHIAGFIYIGTPAEQPEERERPEMAQITTIWTPGVALNKGDGYGHPGKGFPRTGFDFSGLS
jgi:nitroreductase